MRYQIDQVASIEHPMLIADIKDNYIEIIAIDKTAGKLHNLYHKYNYFINSENPKETVLYEDSYAQLNTKLTIENCTMLSKFRRTKDTLSSKKLNDLLKEYHDYQNNNIINEERIVYMTKEEIIELNS